MDSHNDVLYSKVDILIRDNDVNSLSIKVLSFTNCKIILSSDYLIIEHTLIDKSMIGEIYHLKNIVSYKKTK
jgi:hypothetical protein